MSVKYNVQTGAMDFTLKKKKSGPQETDYGSDSSDSSDSDNDVTGTDWDGGIIQMAG